MFLVRKSEELLGHSVEIDRPIVSVILFDKRVTLLIRHRQNISITYAQKLHCHKNNMRKWDEL